MYIIFKAQKGSYNQGICLCIPLSYVPVAGVSKQKLMYLKYGVNTLPVKVLPPF
jgi:hypothetical protein